MGKSTGEKWQDQSFYKHEKIKQYCNTLLHQNQRTNSNLITLYQTISPDEIQKENLQILLDNLQAKLDTKVACLTFRDKKTLTLLVAVGQNSSNSIKAGSLIKQLASHFQGKGGGRPDKARGVLPLATKDSDIFKKFDEITN